MKAKTIRRFVDIGMKNTKENVKMLKLLHNMVTYAACVTTSNGGYYIFTDSWDISQEQKDGISHTNYLKYQIDHNMWIIPMRHRSESKRGYMSRLNAWAWNFTLCTCISYTYDFTDYSTKKVFDDFSNNITIVGVYKNMNICCKINDMKIGIYPTTTSLL